MRSPYRVAVALLLAVGTLTVTVPARADWHGGYGWHHPWHRYGWWRGRWWGPRVFVAPGYVPPPVYYAPPPAYYPPPPVYYAPGY